jgi:PTS system nitrogen regulatory IIA component
MTILRITDLVSPSRVLPDLAVRDREDLLRTLALRLATEAPGRAADDLAAAAAVAANRPPLMIRGGVSLLHIFVGDLPGPIAIVARLRRALDLDGTAGCATDIVALLASPAAGVDGHLRALACLARRLRRPDVLAHVRATRQRDLIYLALTSDEWCAPDGSAASSHAGGGPSAA